MFLQQLVFTQTCKARRIGKLWGGKGKREFVSAVVGLIVWSLSFRTAKRKKFVSTKSLCRMKSPCIKYLLPKGAITLHLDLICSQCVFEGLYSSWVYWWMILTRNLTAQSSLFFPRWFQLQHAEEQPCKALLNGFSLQKEMVKRILSQKAQR